MLILNVSKQPWPSIAAASVRGHREQQCAQHVLGGRAMVVPLGRAEAQAPPHPGFAGDRLVLPAAGGGAPISHPLITADVRCFRRFANFIWVTLADGE